MTKQIRERAIAVAALLAAVMLALLLTANLKDIVALAGLLLAMIVIVGIVPFLLGAAVQLVVRRGPLPTWAKWLLAVLLVLPAGPVHKQVPVAVAGPPILSWALSLLVMLWFVSFGGSVVWRQRQAVSKPSASEV